MNGLAVALVWIGLVVLIFNIPGILSVIGFFAAVGAAFWATARLLEEKPSATDSTDAESES